VSEQTQVHPSPATPLRARAGFLRLAGGRRVPRYALAVLVLALLAAGLAAALSGGRGHHARARLRTSAGSSPAARAHPSSPATASAPATSTPRTVREGTTATVGGARRTVGMVADPQEASSYPAPASALHSAASSPAKAGEAFVAAGAQSDAEVKAELAQLRAVEEAARRKQKLSLTPVPGGFSIAGNGTIPIPPNVPEVIQRVIAGANEIANFPYVYGGGHASFIDNAYDCSGSVSYALAAGGLISRPETSGELESWGAPGPGRYITVLANAGHTYMYVDGILYDTAGRSGVYASRWLVQPTDNSGYVVRHYPGL
jgi:cell wall-associated NlpC family hydrolase